MENICMLAARNYFSTLYLEVFLTFHADILTLRSLTSLDSLGNLKFLDLCRDRFGNIGGHLELKQGEIKTSNPVIVLIDQETHETLGPIQKRARAQTQRPTPPQASCSCEFTGTTVQNHPRSLSGMLGHLEAITRSTNCGEVTSQKCCTSEGRGSDPRTDDLSCVTEVIQRCF